MIGTPKRSVTRFFIPLIDVLLLLFCIFLLMPFVDKTAVSTSKLTHGQVEQLKRQLALLEKKVEELEKSKDSNVNQQIIEDLQEELKKSGIDKLSFRNFRIDGKTGELWYYDDTLEGDRVKTYVKTKQEAEKLVDRDLEQLVGSGKEKVYLVLYPEEESGRPYRSDRDRIQGWFSSKNVKLRWETGTPMGGMQP